MTRASITKAKSLVLGIACSVFITMPLWSDDTEIFFGGTNSNAGVRPNVLFILDTSGSMTSTDGTGITRLDRMKDALRSILQSASNINVGLMRFSSPGGPILYPVNNIEEDVCNIESCSNNSAQVGISASTDDAEEDSAGSVVLAETDLNMGSDVKHGAASATTIEVAVATSSDDVEEHQDGGIVRASSDLEVTYEISGLEQKIGLRFQSVSIPQGATIAYAELVFKVDEDPRGDVSIDIYGEDSDDAVTFPSSTNAVSSRTKTTAKVDWDELPTVDTGGLVRSPDVTNIVQEIVNRGGWSTGNNMAFILNKDPASTSDNNNKRTFESFDGSYAPKLRVTYLTGSGLGDTSQTVGLRFQNVVVPQGATITSARIEFESDKTNSSATSLTIKGEDVDNSTTFTTAASNISSRTTTTASVAWNSIAAWDKPDIKQQSPDIKTLVQEIVDRSGWCGGNAMSFIITGTGARVAKSYDGSTGSAPRLKIEYDASGLTSGQGCVSSTVIKQVSTGADDAEERVSSGSVNLSSSDLEIIKDGTATQLLGMRFRDVKIPQGATIQSSNLEFEIDESGSNTLTVKVYAQAHDDAPVFTVTNADISSRTKTGTSVSWSISSNPAVNAKLTSPDIKTVIQEVINRSGWVSGNDLVILIERQSGGGRRTVEAYDGEPIAAPKLTIQATWNQGDSSGGAVTTVRNRLISIVDDMQWKGSTPIVDSMYEAALYFRGGNVDYGVKRGDSSGSRREYTRVSHPASYTGGSVSRDSQCTDDNLNHTSCRTETINGTATYKSPISASCQRNYVVLLSDGSPTYNVSTSKIKSMAGITSCADSGSAACGPEFAKYLNEKDQSTTFADKQTITTYTIGFNFTGQWLKDVASNGGGSFYEASSASQLTNVFQSILAEILQVDTTFVSPGAAVNQFNRLTHRDEIYFSLFKPSSKPYWAGNLKRYAVDGKPPQVVDKNSAPAVDNASGFFKATSQSFWSAAVDGNDVTKGGFAEQISLSSRKVFTYTGTNTDLSDATNKLDETNSAVTKAMLGISAQSDAYRTDLLKWARGVDIKDYDGDGNVTEVRKQIGDPLHSRPVIVTYGGTDSSPDTTIFVGTNEGYLYAVDGETGQEVFSFVPQELLPNLDTFYQNSSSSSKPYGLDGTITVWVKDVDGDHQIEPSDGDHVYIYFGMRRGGRNYYALDVTDRTKPKLLWTITPSTTGYSELGQTWSAPIKAKVLIDTNEKDVLIFGGGYDPDQDTYVTRTADTQGRAIYMADAKTGALIWSAGISSGSFDNKLASMQYSIPSDVRVLDTNGNGYANQLWVGDMGGQLFRFDISNGQKLVSNLVTGGPVLNVSGTAAADNRRFYYAPDISLIKKNGSLALNVAIGSGWRAHPLDAVVKDKFYNLTTTDVYEAPSTYPSLSASDLYDATANLIGQGSSSQKSAALSDLAAKNGWLLNLETAGEKVLAQSVTVNNQILFTTYIPNVATTGCQAAQGGGRAYLVNAADATPVLNLDQLGSITNLTKGDRYYQLSRGGIPPTPTPFFPDNGTSPIVLIGPEKGPAVNFGELTGRTYWYEQSN